MNTSPLVRHQSPDGQNSPNADDKANFQVPPFTFDRLGLRVPTLIVSPWVPEGAVLNRNLQHTSVIKTAIELFGLDGPLNHRDASAASFADLFTQQPSPRAPNQMPNKLKRPSLDQPIVSLVAGIPVDPADEPLDTLTEEWVNGFAAIADRRTASFARSALAVRQPRTQGEAADLIENCLKSLGL